MKKTKAIYLVAVLAVSALLLSAVNVGAVSEEAQRYFDRGMATVEMAKSPDDYAPAIKEFEQAARLAPDWPDVYYNLGMVQEKAGKYRDAITSLKQYLRLAPNASDATTVKSLINKLEFKAEQVLTPKDYAEIFVSLADRNMWSAVGEVGECFNPFGGFPPELVGNNLVRVNTAHYYDPTLGKNKYEVMRIEGSRIRLTRVVNNCEVTLIPSGSGCPSNYDIEIEIFSRDKVKIRTTVYSCLYTHTPKPALYDCKNRYYSCEYVRK